MDSHGNIVDIKRIIPWSRFESQIIQRTTPPKNFKKIFPRSRFVFDGIENEAARVSSSQRPSPAGSQQNKKDHSSQHGRRQDGNNQQRQHNTDTPRNSVRNRCEALRESQRSLPERDGFPSGCLVLIAFVKEVNKLFIQSVEEAEQLYWPLFRGLSNVWPKCLSLKVAPSCGSYIAVHFRDTVYRGRVLDVLNKLATVLLIDYGETISTDVSHLREIPDWVTKIPPAVVEVTLRDIPPSRNNDLVIKILEKYSQHGLKFKLVYEGAMSEGVELIGKDERSVNTIIKSFWEREQEPANDEHLKLDVLEEGRQILYVMNFCDSNVAYCVRKTRQAKMILSDMSKRLAKPGDIKQFKPQVNELCAWFTNKSWFRVLCKKLSLERGTADIYAVDFGVNYTAKLSSLFELPDEFKKVPFLAVKCIIKGLSPETVKARPALIGVVSRIKGNVSYEVKVQFCYDKENVGMMSF